VRHFEQLWEVAETGDGGYAVNAARSARSALTWEPLNDARSAPTSPMRVRSP